MTEQNSVPDKEEQEPRNGAGRGIYGRGCCSSSWSYSVADRSPCWCRCRVRGSTRAPQLQANYAPWPFVPLAPINPNLLADAARDLGLSGLIPLETAIGCLLPGGELCDGHADRRWPDCHLDSLAQRRHADGHRQRLTYDRRPHGYTHRAASDLDPDNYEYAYEHADTDAARAPCKARPAPAGSLQALRQSISTSGSINYGSPAPANLTRVTDTLPAHMSYRAGSCVPATCTVAGQCRRVDGKLEHSPRVRG